MVTERDPNTIGVLVQGLPFVMLDGLCKDSENSKCLLLDYDQSTEGLFVNRIGVLDLPKIGVPADSDFRFYFVVVSCASWTRAVSGCLRSPRAVSKVPCFVATEASAYGACYFLDSLPARPV
jgi:hypothetical protein